MTTEGPGVSIIGEPKEHNHLADWDAIKARKAVQRMVEAASETREPPARILQTEKVQLDSETCVAMPKDATVKKRLQRARRRGLPSLPQSLADLEDLPPRYTLDNDGNQWLLGDSKTPSRCLVFCSAENLRHLSKSTMWIMDGTFKNSPSLFCQLYSIHGFVRGIWVPLVFVLMEKKDEESYVRVLTMLKEKASKLLDKEVAPHFIAVDFEAASHNAVKRVFPKTTIAGCAFHFGQIMFRRLQAEGLQGAHNSADGVDVRRSFKAICGLCCVPLADVDDAFEVLREEVPESLQPLLDHLETTYVRGRKTKRGMQPPQFPPHTWNCVERIEVGLPRTTNTCEGWHSRMNVIFVKHHPSVYEFLEVMLKEMAEVKVDILRMEFGASPKKKRAKYRRVDRALERLVDNFDTYKDDDLFKYMVAVGHNLGHKVFDGAEDICLSESQSPVFSVSSVSPSSSTPSRAEGKKRKVEVDHVTPPGRKKRKQAVDEQTPGKKVPSPQGSPSPQLGREDHSEVSRPSDATLFFQPPTVTWQKKTCVRLGLRFHKSSRLPGRITKAFKISSPPVKFKRVQGDGACFFRCISYVVSGSEDHHLKIRNLVCDEIETQVSFLFCYYGRTEGDI